MSSLSSELWGQPWEAAGPKELAGWMGRWTWGILRSQMASDEGGVGLGTGSQNSENLPLNVLQ